MADSNSKLPATRPAFSEPSGSSNSKRKDNQRDRRDQRGRGGGRGKGQARGKDRGSRERNERNPSKRGGRGEKGRGEWSRNPVDKRKRNDDEQAAKRQKVEDGDSAPALFTAEEIASEARQPKRKVAVFIGYAGSGYKGMQINTQEKTIEGDLFKAFIAAGAISKANADDPKKSSLVRCARTDKGVHAAGNMISLKLIVEDPDIVKKINEYLPDQIRVWGIERTNGSFSCYQTCDSRWYEYLIPTYSFLPPHPQSFLGKKLVEVAEKEGVLESYKSRQEEVSDFWENVEEKYVKPILDRLDPNVRVAVMEVVHKPEEETPEDSKKVDKKKAVDKISDSTFANTGAINITDDIGISIKVQHDKQTGADIPYTVATDIPDPVESEVLEATSIATVDPLTVAVKEVKAAYIKAKKSYRIPDKRRQRVQDTLSTYLGTQNFHNYTIQKSFKDPSAKRVIRSFKVGTDPIIINDTEWLSLKVHGQSFMMHQIRKMVAMAALVVRCGSNASIIRASYGPDNISIPKAPGLGLLLERPVFDSYNDRAVKDLGREKLEFDKFEKEIDEFKQKEIYERIFREEEKEHQFHTFFHHIDHYRSDWFLWVTAAGISASKQSLMKEEQVKGSAVKMEMDSEDEVDAGGGEEG